MKVRPYSATEDRRKYGRAKEREVMTRLIAFNATQEELESLTRIHTHIYYDAHMALQMAHTDEMGEEAVKDISLSMELLGALADLIGVGQVNALIAERKESFEAEWEGTDQLPDPTFGQPGGGTE
jgi:hypothetical protein